MQAENNFCWETLSPGSKIHPRLKLKVVQEQFEEHEEFKVFPKSTDLIHTLRVRDT